MTLDEYQQQALKTASYPNVGSNLTYPTLGLAGEVGEIANSVKKIMRDDGGELTPERRESLLAEAGDSLWYLALYVHEEPSCAGSFVAFSTFAQVDNEAAKHKDKADLYTLTAEMASVAGA